MHTTHKNQDQIKDSTTYFNNLSNNALVLSSKDLSHGTVLKFNQKDIQKVLSKENWKSNIQITFTKYYIDHFSYCLTNIDKKLTSMISSTQLKPHYPLNYYISIKPTMA